MSKKYLFLGLLIVSFLVAPLFLRAETSTDDVARLIASLKQQIAELQRQLIQLQGQAGRQCFMFNRNLGVGASGRDVRELQAVLAKEGFPVSSASVISSASQTISSNSNDGDDDEDDDKSKNKKIENENNRTDRYTEATAAAVSAFQEKYRSEILTPNGLASPTGYVGPSTRRVLNRLYGCDRVVLQPSQKLRVISPNGGEVWVKGSEQMVNWTKIFNKNTTYTYISINLKGQPNSGSMPFLVGGNVFPIVSSLPYTTSDIGNYNWQVGKVLGPADAADVTLPDGLYTIEICYVDTWGRTPASCDASDSYFKIVPENIIGNPPVISGVSGPTTRDVGQTGTWTVNASDPENGTLNYSVTWGDEPMIASGSVASPSSVAVQQTATFTHTYARVGTYHPTFTVTDNSGQSARTSLSVRVGQNQLPFITVTSPNGGEQWVANSTHAITWRYDGATSATKVDLWLQAPMPVCPPGMGCIQVMPSPIVLDRNIAALSTYNWLVGTDVVNNPIPSGQYRVFVCPPGSSSPYSTGCDGSDNNFMFSPGI